MMRKHRILALLLVGTMLLSMAAGAAFKDQKKITRMQAVAVVDLLGIMSGYKNGNFTPAGQVTRGEMAKMLYVLCTGSDDASQYAGVRLPFTDLTGHWAVNYIKYCYSIGLLGGKSSTAYVPDGTITAAETARMLLILDGYDSARAGFSGTKWVSNVLRYASQTGLLKDITISLTGPLTREYAAQLLTNAIDIGAVKWSSNAAGFKATGKTLGESRMRLSVLEGKLVGAMGISMESGSTCKLVSALLRKDGETTITTIPNLVHNYIQLLGKHVKSYSRVSGINYGMVADDYNAVNLEVKGSKVKGIDGKNRILVDKTEYDVNTDKVMIVYVDAVQDSTNKSVYNLSIDTKTVEDSPVDLAVDISAGGSSTAHVISNDGDYTVDVIVFYTKNAVKYFFVK